MIYLRLPAPPLLLAACLCIPDSIKFVKLVSFPFLRQLPSAILFTANSPVCKYVQSVEYEMYVTG
jgi:hypothetical protein